ncbi:MAG: alpha/beta fold hydrolase, partial [Chloroflexi bacterium]|nr:alpha/beta fold hydrolase [Chloroflexota bacterium]
MADAPLYANVNGIRVAYDRTGDGFPLLLLHGFPRTRRTWAQVTPPLAERFTVVAPDRRGYGDSDRPSDPATYDNAHMAQDALELTQQLGWKAFLVV